MSVMREELSADPYLVMPRYELSSRERDALTQKLLEDVPPVGQSQFSCYEVIGGRYADIARNVELVVLEESFGNSSETLEKEYGEFEETRRFFMVIDNNVQRPVGVLSVIEASQHGLKTLNDIEKFTPGLSIQQVRNEYGISDISTCWDVGTVAVLPEYRARHSDMMVSSTLYRSLYAAAMSNGIDHLVSIIDEKAYKQLLLLGIPFMPMLGSEPFEYIGSEKSYAVYGHVPEFYRAMSNRKLSLSSGMRDILGRYMDRLMTGEGVPASQLVPSNI